MDKLLIEIAGLLNLLAEGYTIPNLREQSKDLLDKIGKALHDVKEEREKC